MEYTQADRDMLIKHDVKLCELTKDVKEIKAGIN